MSTKYRIASDDTTNTTEDSNNEVVSKLTTDMTGVKVINDIKLKDDILTLGIDGSKRNWDGEYIGYGAKAGLTGLPSIQDVDTNNKAIFTKYNKNIDKLNLKFGARINDTTINTANTNYKDRDFNSLDINLLATYSSNKTTKYFAGIGRASRVPDGRELYFNSSMNVMSGTPTLDQTTNTEIDLGFERKNENGYFKLKAYYSKLNDYIYFNKDNIKIINKKGTIYKTAYNAFENIDAKTYGLELLGSYDISDDSSLDFGASYQRGKKDKPMTGTIVDTTNNTTTTVQQTNTNLADITPLKINVALNYDIDDSLSTKIELVHVNSWNKYDDDNGEQYLQGYNIINIKAKKEFNKKFEATIGVDNLFDKTYAISNTYADLILLSDGTSGEVMLLNEPGRYIYANIKYKF
jgi:iron complex outermembrane receptor protein